MTEKQQIQDLKLFVKENQTRYVLDEESDKMEEMIVSTVAVKLRYGSEQYGEYIVYNKPTLEVSDVVDAANELFVSLLSALDHLQEGKDNV